jgi:hypothetical protein
MTASPCDTPPIHCIYAANAAGEKCLSPSAHRTSIVAVKTVTARQLTVHSAEKLSARGSACDISRVLRDVRTKRHNRRIQLQYP